MEKLQLQSTWNHFRIIHFFLFFVYILSVISKDVTVDESSKEKNPVQDPVVRGYLFIYLFLICLLPVLFLLSDNQ